MRKLLDLLKKVRTLIMSVFGFDENKNKSETVDIARFNELERIVKNKFATVTVAGLTKNVSKEIKFPTNFTKDNTCVLSWRMTFHLTDGTYTSQLVKADNTNLIVNGKYETYPRILINNTNTGYLRVLINWEDSEFSDTVTSVDISIQLMRTDI